MHGTGNFVGRSAWLGGVVGGALALLSGAVPASAQPAVIFAQKTQHALARSKTDVHVELDDSADPGEVSTALGLAGLPALDAIDLASDRLHVYVLPSGPLTPQQKDAVLAIPGVAAVRPAYRLAEIDRPLILTDDIVVRCTPGSAEAVAQTYGLDIVEHLDWLGDVFLMRLRNSRDTDAALTAATMHGDARTVYAHPDMIGLYRTHEVRVDDPFFPAQWHLNNVGGDGGLRGADIAALDAWEITEGEGVLVALLDDAFDITHEDLLENYSGIAFDAWLRTNDPRPDLPFSLEAHGTATTGLICAAGNGVGVRGVAPKAKFMPIQLHTCGFALCTTSSQIANGFRFALVNGADLISNSWGGPFVEDVLVDAIQEVARRGRGGRGMLVLFSSGNGGGFISALAAEPQIPEVMAVGALMRDGTLSCYSNFGPQQSVTAPGGGAAFVGSCFKADIVTTDIMDEDGYNSSGFPVFFGIPFPLFPPDPNELADRNYTNGFNGTSAACPVAAGVAVLALSVNPRMTGTQLRNLIEHTATKADLFRADFDIVTGHNVRHGHGRVNAHAAAVAAQAGHLWPAPVNTIDGFSANDAINLVWKNPTDDPQVNILVVRAIGGLQWAPEDLAEIDQDGRDNPYPIGTEVAPGVIVVANGPVSRLEEVLPVEGTVEYGLFVRNAQGRYSWGRRKVVITSIPPDAALPPLVTVRATPTLGPAPLAVEFAGGTTGDVDAISFEWDFGDGTNAFGQTTTHGYTEPGVYHVLLAVTSSRRCGGEPCRGEATTVITVGLPNVPPSVTIQAVPVTGLVPLEVTFIGGGDDPDGSIVRFLWDFGDDTEPLEGSIVNHEFTRSGTFTVTLTVVDDVGGTTQGTVDIEVSDSSTDSAFGDVGGAQVNQPAPRPSLAPFCGALGIESLALAAAGLLFAGFAVRRRDA